MTSTEMAAHAAPHMTLLESATRLTPVANPQNTGSGIDHITKAVGGHFDVAFTVRSPDGHPRCLTGYVHDEGLIIGLPIHVAIRYPSGYVTMLAGNMLMQGLDESTGESLGLTATEIAYIESRRKQVEVFPYEGYLFGPVAFYDFTDPVQRPMAQERV